jgi:sulfoxide reductase heme-binding subunit YedZ
MALQWPFLLQLRRMIGVAAFAYATVHLSLYVVDEAFDVPTVILEIILRIYLTIGFVALLGLGVLAVTSTDQWQRSLGARRWQNLHRLIYFIALLAVIHFFLQSKLDEWEPTVMAGIYLWLMAFRAITARYGRGKLPLWPLAATSVAAGALTALGEAVYFSISLGAPIPLVLAANLSLETGLRPSWVVFAATGAIAVLGWLRSIVKSRARARLKTA